MLTCDKTQPLLEDYLANQLPEEQQTEIRRHITNCADCRRELEQLNRFNKLLEAVRFPDPAEEFWNTYPDKVRHKITSSVRQVKLYRLKVALAGGLSGAALILLGLLIYPLVKPTVPLPPQIRPVTSAPQFSGETVYLSPLTLRVNNLLRLYTTIQGESNRQDIESELVDNIGRKSTPYVAQMLESLLRKPNRDNQLCHRLIAVLGRLQDNRAVPVLINATDISLLRPAALESLCNISDLSSIPTLVKYYSVESFQYLIAQTIKQMGQRGENVLVNLFYTNQTTTRQNAIRLIGYLKIKSSLPILANLANDRNLKPLVIEALGNIGRPEAVPALVELAKESALSPTIYAAVKKIGPDAIPYLATYFSSPDARLSQRAFEMMAVLEDKRVVPYLIASLSERKRQVKAGEALRNITSQDFGKNQQQWWQWWSKESQVKSDKKSRRSGADKTI